MIHGNHKILEATAYFRPTRPLSPEEFGWLSYADFFIKYIPYRYVKTYSTKDCAL
jgi:hypothetical protein